MKSQRYYHAKNSDALINLIRAADQPGQTTARVTPINDGFAVVVESNHGRRYIEIDASQCPEVDRSAFEFLEIIES